MSSREQQTSATSNDAVEQDEHEHISFDDTNVSDGDNVQFAEDTNDRSKEEEIPSEQWLQTDESTPTNDGNLYATVPAKKRRSRKRYSKCCWGAGFVACCCIIILFLLGEKKIFFFLFSFYLVFLFLFFLMKTPIFILRESVCVEREKTINAD
jgi:hypothetical protein